MSENDKGIDRVEGGNGKRLSQNGSANVGVNRLVRLLPMTEYVACFLPIAVLLADQAILRAAGYTVLPYSHIDKGYFFVGMFVVIVACVAISIELRSSALGPDAFTSVRVQSTSFEMPMFGTTKKLVDSFFTKKARAEKTTSVIWYAWLLLVAEFSFSCMVAAGIYVSYFRK